MVKNNPDDSDFPEGQGRQPSLFAVLDGDTHKLFVDRCKKVTFDSGQSIFIQGNDHSFCYIINEGLIRTYYVAPSGREATLGYWSTGDLVGGPSVFGGGPHIWSAVAQKPSKVLAISGPELRKFAGEHNQVYSWLIDVLDFKLRWLSTLFQIHGTENVQERLAKLLLMLGDIYGEENPGGTIIKQKISQNDLATLVGASRQWTNKALKQLAEKGLLSIDDQFMTLHDPVAFRAMIGDEGPD
ncbi:MAG: Crp/Fnr family transcriptional regulator [Rhodospirillales bacterium]|nr:Crp/Fnr family transcriptional regulator [Rhodospirillales bacterium]